MAITKTNEDGSRTSIPADPRNRDYQEYLKETGKTHQEVRAELKAEEDAVEATLKTERNKQKALRASAKAKLIALGLTGQEFKELFGDN